MGAVAPLSARPGDCRCHPEPEDLPEPLLTAHLDDQGISPPLTTLGVGYELKIWRADALAGHVLDWVLDFAMRPEERRPLSPGRARQIMRRAVDATFGNGADRGVPGEVLLHAVCRQFFGSDTVISKVFFKTADNDTYKGFDGVHCVHDDDDELELWLGEAKFYRRLGQAIAAALDDLDEHLERGYLRNEFAIVSEKIDDSHPHAEELRRLMHPNTSLDEVFDRIVVPVLIAYDSAATHEHEKVCPAYLEDLEAEARRAWLRFSRGVDASLPVTVRLFLIPMDDKKTLLDCIEAELAR